MLMKLYDFPQSPNCRKVRIYLAEKGLSVPLQPVDLLAGEQRSPAFLRRNPFGAVPILELDDGMVIPESLAIIEYLEEQHPQPPLLGTEPLSRAQVRAWERRCELGVLLQATRRFLHSSPFFSSRVVQNPQVVNEAAQVLRERLTLLDAQLRDHEWVAGGFSLADITLLTGIDFAAVSGFTLAPAWLHLSRWYAAMRARPSATA
jgi:glutathione S-transferase